MRLMIGCWNSRKSICNYTIVGKKGDGSKKGRPSAAQVVFTGGSVPVTRYSWTFFEVQLELQDEAPC